MSSAWPCAIPVGRVTALRTLCVAAELGQVQDAAGQGSCVDAARPDGRGYSLEHDLDGKSGLPQFAMTLVRIPEGLVDDWAILVSGSFPIGWFGAGLAEVGRGDTVLVLGAGAVGQFVVASRSGRAPAGCSSSTSNTRCSPSSRR